MQHVATDPNPPAYQLPADPAKLAREQPRLTRRFWKKIRAVASYLPFAGSFLAAFHAAVDPKTPTGAKAILLGAIAYFIMPIDMIPDMLAAMGYGDDLAVILAAMRAVESSITDAHREKARIALEKLRQQS